jgi:hypothetical protein
MKLDLPTMAEVEESRKGQSWPKGLPRPLVKQEKKKAKATLEREFREGVWSAGQEAQPRQQEAAREVRDGLEQGRGSASRPRPLDAS